MGKASFASHDAVNVQFGIQEGNVEVIGAVSKVHQYPPSKDSGEQGEPFGCVQLEFQQYDSKWNKLDDEPVKMEFGFGKLDKFHPGLATGPSDDDPADQGDEVDVEGNCIVAVADGAKLNKKSKWIILTASMEAVGFKPEVLGNGYLPDVIGTRGHVKSIAQDRMPNSTAKKDPTALVFDRIDTFPYEKAGKSKPVAGKPAGTAGKTPAKPSPAASPAPSGDDDETVAIATLDAIKTEQAGETLELKALKSKATAKLMRNKVPLAKHKPILALLSDPAWLTEQAEAMEFAFDADGGVVQF